MMVKNKRKRPMWLYRATTWVIWPKVTIICKLMPKPNRFKK